MARAHRFGAANPSSEPQKWVFVQHPTFQKHIKITKIATPLIFFPVKADDLYFSTQKKRNPKRNPRTRYFVLIENSSSSFSLKF